MASAAALFHVSAMAPPAIPSAFMATIVSNTTGTVPGIPKGVEEFSQFYDYTNKRLRKDMSNGYTKVYRYDVKEEPAFPPVAGDPPFATPKGYEFRTNDPDVTCCWLWLMDADTKDADRMFEEKIDPKAKDMGPSPLYGGTEHWHKSGWFPFKTTGDWYTNNGTLLHADQYTNIPKEGDVITNTTYSDVKVGPIPESAFAHPDAKPTFGKCKQFGKDPRCPVHDSAKMLAEHKVLRTIFS